MHLARARLLVLAIAGVAGMATIGCGERPDGAAGDGGSDASRRDAGDARGGVCDDPASCEEGTEFVCDTAICGDCLCCCAVPQTCETERPNDRAECVCNATECAMHGGGDCCWITPPTCEPACDEAAGEQCFCDAAFCAIDGTECCCRTQECGGLRCPEGRACAEGRENCGGTADFCCVPVPVECDELRCTAEEICLRGFPALCMGLDHCCHILWDCCGGCTSPAQCRAGAECPDGGCCCVTPEDGDADCDPSIPTACSEMSAYCLCTGSRCSCSPCTCDGVNGPACGASQFCATNGFTCACRDRCDPPPAASRCGAGGECVCFAGFGICGCVTRCDPDGERCPGGASCVCSGEGCFCQ